MLNRLPNVRMCRLIQAAALICFPFIFNNMARSAEPKWPPQLYKYMVIDQDLKDVLIEFGRNIGVHTKISEAVAGRRVRGESTAVSAREFLQRICGSYGLAWYFDGTILHVNTESEIRTELTTLMYVRADKLLERLTALGVTDPRYPIRTTENVSVVSASGPPPFIALVRQTVAALEKSMAPRRLREMIDGDETTVRIFRGIKEGS
jgi:type II secretory pathway component GspD/PulD (secretin)